MICPVNGQHARYSTSDAQTNANGTTTGMHATRSGRGRSAACVRSAITLTGPVRSEMTVATEITAASVPQPRKKNMNTMPEREMPSPDSCARRRTGDGQRAALARHADCRASTDSAVSPTSSR